MIWFCFYMTTFGRFSYGIYIHIFLDFRHLAAFREQNKSDNDLHRTGEKSPPIRLHKAAKKRWRRRQKQHDLPPLKGDVKLLLASDSTINNSHQQFDFNSHRYVNTPSMVYVASVVYTPF